MRYVANPVVVEALKIADIRKVPDDVLVLTFEDGTDYYPEQANPGMLARYIPVVGDYLVIQEDGYVYLNPKNVFERKYSKMESNEC